MNKLKLIIRVASLAMLVAFIFGIVAFVKADKNGELKTLYKTEPTAVIVSSPKVDVEDFSRGIISPPPNISDSIANNKVELPKLKLNVSKRIIQKSNVKKKTIVPKIKYIKKNRDKIISFKSFSRGSLERMPIRAIENTAK